MSKEKKNEPLTEEVPGWVKKAPELLPVRDWWVKEGRSTVTLLLVAAAGGMRVAKHGNRAASSQCGTADCLEALGVNIRQDPDMCRRLLDEVGMCFFFAQQYHTSMKYVGAIRKELGFRTVFNILGPLTNPGSPTMQLLGVYDDYLVEPTLIRKLAHTLTDDKAVLEVALAYCLQDRDLRCFWAQVYQYNKFFPGEPIPRYVQEVMLLFHDLQRTPGLDDISAYKLDSGIVQRYRNFRANLSSCAQTGMSDDQIGAALQSRFGDTFWWDYYIIKKSQSY